MVVSPPGRLPIFVIKINWKSNGGEKTTSFFTQNLGLSVQNFLSAATGMSIFAALVRGIRRHETTALGNFWVDTVRGTLYILLPLALILATVLSSQGVIQNLKPYQTIHLIEPIRYQQSLQNPEGQHRTSAIHLTEEVIPMGPAASQIAIKQLGTNGGGFFNANSAHPFENPTPLSNFIEMLALLLIPAALCYTFGVMVNDKRQGWAILLAMLLLVVPLIGVTVAVEQSGNPAFVKMGIDQIAKNTLSPGGNMEGK